MSSKIRDVTGGSQTWGKFIPGFGFGGYILTIFSTPIESFIRADFGERYYSKGSFIGGLVILFIFKAVTGLFGWFIATFSRVPVAEESYMWDVIKWYVLVGLLQFAIIWVRDKLGKRLISTTSGYPLLLFVGKGILKVVNLLASIVIRFIAAFLPEKMKTLLLNSLPIFRDPRTFTERFIEPIFCLLTANFALNNGQVEIFLWLFVSAMALVVTTSARHEQERSLVLDYLDAFEEARMMQEFLEGKETRNSETLRRTVNEVVKEVDRNPEVFDAIKTDQPTIARAVAAARARQRKQPLAENEAIPAV